MPLQENALAGRVSVSEYSALLGRALRAVGPARVEGEVQKPKLSSGGMLWFSLTDGQSVLSCKVFRNQMRTLEHSPREGDLVVVDVERPDLWAQAGKLDLIVGQIRLAGEGELLRRRTELIERLQAEGLCDPRRRHPLPTFPRAVGVIAGRQSDAMSDVIQALRDRWPAVHVVCCASLVQGKAAPRELIDALATLQEHPLVDVAIIARGGGSVQDLACFDDEGLCRAIFACDMAVISAVGHTDNNPVCNYVAWPAFTPSRSAELAVPSKVAIESELAGAAAALSRGALHLARLGERLVHAGGRLEGRNALKRRSDELRIAAEPLRSPAAYIQTLRGTLEALTERHTRGIRRQHADHSRDYGQALARLLQSARKSFTRRCLQLQAQLAQLGAALPDRARKRLLRAKRDADAAARIVAAQDFRARGWLLAHRNQQPIRSAAELAVGDELQLLLHDGQARVEVAEVAVISGEASGEQAPEFPKSGGREP